MNTMNDKNEVKEEITDEKTNEKTNDTMATKEAVAESVSTEKGKSRFRKFVVNFVACVAIVILSMYAVPTFAAQRTVVDGTSMENNFYDGENLIANKFIYRFKNPQRFDVIVFYPHGRTSGDGFIDFVKNFTKPDDQKDDYYIKRVIGLPGETVQIIGSDIYIDGKILKESYGKDPIETSGTATNPLKLGENEFFVLGDNRKVSEDSRVFGVVNKKNIAGKIVFKLN